MFKENGGPKTVVQVKRPPLKRGNSRGSTNAVPGSKVSLEQVLGVSATSNNSLSYDATSENILYTAGCVCVLYNLKRSKQTHIENHSKKPLTCAAFSSDGKLVVTGESGHQPCVRVWDVATGKQEAELHGHKFGISSVNFSPNAKVVASVGFTHDSNVFVWNWRTGKQVAGNKVSSRVFGMSFSEAGTYFVTVGIRFVKFWYFDSNNDRALLQLSPCENRAAILDAHRNTTFKSVICGRGKFAHLTFCLSTDGRLFSFGESRRVERWLDLKVNDAYALYVTQEHLLCGCSDGVVRIFEPSTLGHIVNLPKPHPLGVNLSACTSPSCMVSLIPNSEFPDCIGVVADSTTNKVIALYRDKSLYIWDITNIQRIGKYRSYLFHSACICAIEVYPQIPEEAVNAAMGLPRGTFITGSSDNTIKIWNLTTLDPDDPIKRNIYSKELLNQIYTDTDFSWLRAKKGNAISDNACGITALAVSPRGDVVASGDKSGNLRVFDLYNLDCSELARIEAHDAEVLSLSFTRPECYWQYLVSASRDRLIHVFDVRNDYQLVQTLCDHSAIVTSVKFVERPADAQLTLLSCSADKSVRFRAGFKSPDQGNQLQFSTYQHVQEKSTFNDMEIPNTRNKVIAGCQDRFIRTYELATGKLVKSFKSGGSEDSGMIIVVTLDPSGTFIAAAGSDKCIFVHDAASGDKIASLVGHSEMITGMKFTNDCKRLISISGDGCIFIWRLSNDVVKMMKNKMRGQGYTPEVSADTPNPNRKGGALSPHNENVYPIDHILRSTVPITDGDTDKSVTPEINKRKRWEKPDNLSLFEGFAHPETLTPSTPQAPDIAPTTRTAPDGGEKDDVNLSNVQLQLDLEKRGESDVITPIDDVTPLEDEDDEDNSQEDSPEEVIYVPPKIMSPTSNNKRLSHVFDVQVTPLKDRKVLAELSDDEDDTDNDTTYRCDDEEEEGKSDSFVRNKFSELNDDELNDDDDDELLDQLPNTSLSPNSKLRQSMSRKFYKSSTPEHQRSSEAAETPRSKAASPVSSPDHKTRLAVQEKIESKRKEKYSLKSSIVRDIFAKDEKKRLAFSKWGSRGDPLRDAPLRDASTGSCDSEEFVIHRRPSFKGSRSRLDESSLSSYEPAETARTSDTEDSNSSKYMSVPSKTSDSAGCTSDRGDTNPKAEKQDKKTVSAKQGKPKKSMFSSIGTTKTKEEKITKTKEDKATKKKEEKAEKTNKKNPKSKTPGAPKEALSELKTSFQQTLDSYDSLMKESQSAKRDEEIVRTRELFKDMMSQIKKRTDNNMAAAAASVDSPTAAEIQICASRILELIQQKPK